jgi:hypothetical protein
LFGTSDPQLYRPGGVTTPAAVVTGDVGGQRSMMGITADAVLAAWRELVSRVG